MRLCANCKKFSIETFDALLVVHEKSVVNLTLIKIKYVVIFIATYRYIYHAIY